MTFDAERKRLLWQCRRGMRELDLLLVPFCENAYPSLARDERAAFRRLLQTADTTLWDWLAGKSELEDPALASIVQAVIEHARSR